MNKLTRKPHTPTLSLWTVYDHPSDYPCHFVARRFDIAGGVPVATLDVFLAPSLTTLRRKLLARGLVGLIRTPRGEPAVVEVWI